MNNQLPKKIKKNWEHIWKVDYIYTSPNENYFYSSRLLYGHIINHKLLCMEHSL